MFENLIRLSTENEFNKCSCLNSEYGLTISRRFIHANSIKTLCTLRKTYPIMEQSIWLFLFSLCHHRIRQFVVPTCLLKEPYFPVILNSLVCYPVSCCTVTVFHLIMRNACYTRPCIFVSVITALFCTVSFKSAADPGILRGGGAF